MRPDLAQDSPNEGPRNAGEGGLKIKEESQGTEFAKKEQAHGEVHVKDISQHRAPCDEAFLGKKHPCRKTNKDGNANNGGYEPVVRVAHREWARALG